MEIHYFWIKQFRSIEEQAITLSSKYIFSTDIDSNSKEGTIVIDYNPNYIPNFFEKPNIENVSAIIGKNGAGKTSILDYILSHFPSGVSSRVTNNTILFFSDNTEKLQLVISKDWNINIINNSNQKINIKEYSKKNTFRFVSGTNSIDFMYYNFFLDYKNDITNWSGVKNLSTSTALSLPRKTEIENRLNRNGSDNSLERTYDIDLFMKSELLKGIQLLVSDKKEIIPFNSPNKLNISILKTDYTYFLRNDEFNKKSAIDLDIISIIEKLEQINQKANIQELMLNNLYIAILINFFVTHFHYSTPHIIKYNFNLKRILKEIGDFDIGNVVKEFFINLKELQPNSKKHKSISNIRFDKLSKIIPEFIDVTQRFVSMRKITFNSHYIEFPLTKETHKDFSKFINLYLEIKGLTNFLEFNWSGLSTGEQSFLSFMSRFYHEKKHAIGKDQMKKNLFIMIDEGDAGFHPQWQKQFFNKSLNFLSDLYVDEKIQLVYTSNSPYIISDLPKNHITFMKNEKGLITILDKNNSLKETFAQNIHTLLSNSFFLESGVMGTFAKNKINKVIELIKREKNKPEDVKEIKDIIKIIGEPVIKRKLSQIFEDKFGFPTDIKNEIYLTEKRLNELKSIENNDKNQ